MCCGYMRVSRRLIKNSKYLKNKRIIKKLRDEKKERANIKWLRRQAINFEVQNCERIEKYRIVKVRVFW